MKHIRLYEDEDLLKDLTNIGFEPSIGFMFLGITSPRQDDRPLAFLVKGKDEPTCAQMIIDSMGKSNSLLTSNYHKGTIKHSFDTMEDLMVYLFEQGYISDSGYYGTFKAKDTSTGLKFLVDEYTINAKIFVDLAYKHFTNADEVFRDYGAPQEFNYYLKQSH